MPPLCSRCRTRRASLKGYPSPDELQAAAKAGDTSHSRDAAGNVSFWIGIRPEQVPLLCTTCGAVYEAEVEGRVMRPLSPEPSG